MTIGRALADILEETVKALREVDSDALHALKQRIAALAVSNDKFA
jgi:hypothetical protein